MSGAPLTYTELADRYGVSERHARRLVKRLGIPVLDLGHRTKRIRPADIDRAEATAAGERQLAKGLTKGGKRS